jgi:hypothetical protein
MRARCGQPHQDAGNVVFDWKDRYGEALKGSAVISRREVEVPRIGRQGLANAPKGLIALLKGEISAAAGQDLLKDRITRLQPSGCPLQPCHCRTSLQCLRYAARGKGITRWKITIKYSWRKGCSQ